MEDAELLAEEQDLNILVLLGATTHPHEVKQQRERLGEKKEEHGGRSCREYAERRERQQEPTRCEALPRLWRALDLFFAPYGHRVSFLLSERRGVFLAETPVSGPCR